MLSELQLDAVIEDIRGYAKDAGLDFFPTIFEVVDYRRMNEIAGYDGFPNRYPHWRFGMEFERLSKSYAYGLLRISEMVINSNPAYAYLLRCNNPVDQKYMIAHVYAHCDFFKNNMWFAHTNRRMVDEMANHASRIRGLADRRGFDEVEEFLDICLTIDDLIDVQSSFKRRNDQQPGKAAPHGLPERPACACPHADRDILQFLIEYGRLEHWQRDILSMIREESCYFAPQAQTKIINEGWATYWHSKIMTERVLSDSELIDYADHHAAMLVSAAGLRGGFNPYKLGVELFRDIEERWDTGLGQGLQKVFEVRRIYNDVGFIDEFLTRDFCEKRKLFTYEPACRTGGRDERSGRNVIGSRDFETIKRNILAGLTNFGKPAIYVTDGNYRNRGELLLTHRHEGSDLRWDYARDVIANIQRVWGENPVTLQTVVEGTPRLLRFDGSDFQETDGLETEVECGPELVGACA